MKKLFLILFLGIIVASCGRNQTEIPTEIVTETPAVEVEEVSQTETTETTYFDNVFQEDLDGFCGGHLYLTKGMKYFRIENGRGGMQNITYGTYSINNNIVEIVSERSDISRKLEISKSGNEIWLIEINEEYPIKFKLVENDKEIINEFTSIFGSKITESSQNSSTTVNLSVEEMFSTVESTSKYIENTVWTHTTVGSTIWTRFVFSNGGVKVYSAFPRDGKWGAPKEYAYEIKERRFSNTGEKYISIIVNGDKSMNWEICPERGILRTPGGRQVSLELGDYQWD